MLTIQQRLLQAVLWLASRLDLRSSSAKRLLRTLFSSRVIDPPNVERLLRLLSRLSARIETRSWATLGPIVAILHYPLFISISDIIEAIIGGVFSIFETFLNFLGDTVGDAIAGHVLDALLYTPLPQYCPGGGSVSSCSNPRPALLTQPTNGAWPQIWDLYWSRFFVTALIIGLFLYVMTTFVSTIPFMPPSLRKKMDGAYFRFLFLLILGWPLLTFGLFLMDFVINMVAPNPDRMAAWIGGVLAGALGAAGVVGATGVGAILVAALGMLNIGLIVITISVFFVRILYLMFFMALAPLFIMGWALKIPMVEGLSATMARYWFKLGIAPVIVAGSFYLAAIVMTEPASTSSLGTHAAASGGVETANATLTNTTAASVSETESTASTASVPGYDSGDYELTGFGPYDLGTFIAVPIAFLIPVFGIGGFVLALQASLPASAGMAVSGAASKVPGSDKSVGEVSVPGSDKTVNQNLNAAIDSRKAGNVVQRNSTESVAAATMTADEVEIYQDSNAESAEQFMEQRLEAGHYGDADSVDDVLKERVKEFDRDEMDNLGEMDFGGGPAGWDHQDSDAVEKMTKEEYQDFQKSDYSKPSQYVENELTASATDPGGPQNLSEWQNQRDTAEYFTDDDIEEMHVEMAASDDFGDQQQEAFERLNHNEQQELTREFHDDESEVDDVQDYLKKKMGSDDPMYAGMDDIDDFNAQREVQVGSEMYRDAYEDIQEREDTENWWDDAARAGDDGSGQEFAADAEWVNEARGQTTVDTTAFKDSFESNPEIDNVELQTDVFSAMNESEKHDAARMAADPDSEISAPTDYIEQETDADSVTEWMQGRDTRDDVVSAVGRNRAQDALQDVTFGDIEAEVDMDDASIDQQMWHNEMDADQQEEYLEHQRSRQEAGKQVQSVSEFVDSQVDQGRADNVEDWLDSDRREREDLGFNDGGDINTDELERHLKDKMNVSEIEQEALEQMSESQQHDFGKKYAQADGPVESVDDYVAHETESTTVKEFINSGAGSTASATGTGGTSTSSGGSTSGTGGSNSGGPDVTGGGQGSTSSGTQPDWDDFEGESDQDSSSSSEHSTGTTSTAGSHTGGSASTGTGSVDSDIDGEDYEDYEDGENDEEGDPFSHVDLDDIEFDD